MASPSAEPATTMSSHVASRPRAIYVGGLHEVVGHPAAPTDSATSPSRRGRADGEDGSVTVELVVVAPVLLLLLLVAVQAGMWWHATHIAESVAAHALAAARAQDGTAASGYASGQGVAAQLAGQMLTDVEVVIDRGPDVTSVEVTGTALAVIPGVALPVRAEATGTSERATP